MNNYQYAFYVIIVLLFTTNRCDQTNSYMRLVKEGNFNSLSEIFNHILNKKKVQVSSNQELQSYNPLISKLRFVDKILNKDRSDENFKKQIAVVVFANKNPNRILSLDDKYQNDFINMEKVMQVARTVDDESAGSKENNVIPLERGDEQEQSAEDCTSSELVSTDEEIQNGEDRTQTNVKRFGRKCRKSTRRCIKACRDTYKSVCRYYKCSTGMRSMFKRKCRRNCKDRISDY